MSQTNKPDSENRVLGADEQIQAHRQQHQLQLKKMLGLVGGLIILILIGLGIFNVVSADSPLQSGEPTSASQASSQEYSQAQIEEYRDEFKQALTDYEVNIQPEIDKILVTDWEPSATNELALQKQQMLSSFAQGLFLQAKTQFEKLKNDSQALIEKRKTETQAHIDAAKVAFEAEKIPQAQLSINKALAIMPGNPQAIALQGRIDAHAEVAGLMADLRVAKIENDLKKQIDLLDNIIQLDPAREELNEDLDKAKTQYDAKQLANYLNEAEQALNENRLQRAESFVKQAKAIKPSSEGAASLQAKINAAKRGQSLQVTKEKLEQLASNDQWEDVLAISAQGLKQYTNDDDLFDFQQQAQQIVQAKKSLSTFISRPERLADTNIREAASSAIQKAFGASLQSPSLQAQIEQLASLLDNYNVPVEVTINSDGNTYIVVVGVGHVGQHQQKTIELTPGNYVLQGKRAGFKNKRLNFTVETNSPLTLSLVCDEPIQ